MTNFKSVLFNTQLKSLSHDCRLSKFINIILALVVHHTEDLKVAVGEVNMITVTFQAKEFEFLLDQTILNYG